NQEDKKHVQRQHPAIERHPSCIFAAMLVRVERYAVIPAQRIERFQLEESYLSSILGQVRVEARYVEVAITSDPFALDQFKRIDGSHGQK
ncbi:hypothetical protein ACC772_38370, partial [Rhizobium ruizarguesonis]